MSIAYRSSTGYAWGYHYDPMPLGKPSGLANGDLLLLFAISNAAFFSWPSGFTQGGHSNSYQSSIGWAYKVITNAAGEPSTYYVGRSSTEDIIGCAVAYSGVDLNNPFVDWRPWFNPSQTSRSATFFDMIVVANGVMVGFGGTRHWEAGGDWTAAPGYTRRITQDLGLTLQDRTVSTAGYSGNMNFQANQPGFMEWISTAHVSLRPASGGAPFAPQLLNPVATTINRQQAQRFSWIHSDPDGDPQRAYDIRYRIVGAPSWITVSETTGNSYRDFAPATFSVGNYEWQARTYGPTLTGAWSASAYFTAEDPPPPPASVETPTILVPVNDTTVGASLTVEWSAPEQDIYQMQTIGEVGATGAELCQNPTAEVDASFWESNPAFGVFEPATVGRSNLQAHGGSWSIRAQWPTNPGKWSWVNSYATNFLPGGTYRVTGWVYIPAGSPPMRPSIAFTAYGATITQTDQWVFSELTFVATSTQHHFGWETVQNPATNQQAFVDDVSCTLVSEAADPSIVYTDTGEVTSTTRSALALFGVDGRHEYVRVRVKVGSTWSEWDIARVLVAHTLPPTPLVQFVAQDALGALDIQITNPAPEPGQPTVVRNEIWIDEGGGLVRHKAAQPPNSTFRHETPIALWDYNPLTVRVLAVANDGTFAWSNLFQTFAFEQTITDSAGLDDGTVSGLLHNVEIFEEYAIHDSRTIT